MWDECSAAVILSKEQRQKQDVLQAPGKRIKQSGFATQ